MESIADRRCAACRVGTPRATPEEISLFTPQIPLWEQIEEESVKKLRRRFPFPDFRMAADFTNQVADLAEEEGHHPTLITEWGQVTVIWWTQKIGGLHQNDFIMAAKTDRLYKMPA
jgi:4a-hydroxytetrahydrobiopterin dehydratase